MNIGRNPYPEFLIDEVSGIEVPDARHRIWAEGYQAGSRGKPVIRRVIRMPSDMVVVFDDRGEQIPEYQGRYEEVRQHLVKDAPTEAVFGYAANDEGEIRVVSREEW